MSVKDLELLRFTVRQLQGKKGPLRIESAHRQWFLQENVSNNTYSCSA